MGSTVKIFTFDFWIKILLEVIIGTPKKMCDQKPNVFQGRLLLGLKKLTHLVIFEHVDVYPPSMGSTVKIFTFDLWIKSFWKLL